MKKQDICVREMTPADAHVVFDIDRICFSEVWSEQIFLDLFQYTSNHYYVVEQGHTLCGFAGISVAGDTADVMKIGVLPEYRRMGAAQQLLQMLLVKAKETGCEQVMLEVRESNAAARQLYRKNEFEELAVRKQYYTQPVENGIVMNRKLTDFSTVRQ